MELLVLIVPDMGLRSALVGRLSLLGESLVTLTDPPDDRTSHRIGHAPAMLIVDEVVVGEGLQAMRDDPRWAGLIVLADIAAITPKGERFRIVGREQALDGVAAVLAGWRQPLAA